MFYINVLRVIGVVIILILCFSAEKSEEDSKGMTKNYVNKNTTPGVAPIEWIVLWKIDRAVETIGGRVGAWAVIILEAISFIIWPQLW